MGCENLQFIILGDAVCEKSAFVWTFAKYCTYIQSSSCPQYQIANVPPSTMSTASYNVKYQGKDICLSIHDTTGQEEMNHLRVLNYVNTDFALILFAANNLASFYNATQKWAPEYTKHRPGRPFFLVAINPDKRYTSPNSVDLEKGLDAISSIQATRYIESNLQETDGTVNIFLEAIRVCNFDKIPSKKKIAVMKEYKIQVENEIQDLIQKDIEKKSEIARSRMFPDIVIKLQDLKIDDIQGSQEIESPREVKVSRSPRLSPRVSSPYQRSPVAPRKKFVEESSEKNTWFGSLKRMKNKQKSKTISDLTEIYKRDSISVVDGPTHVMSPVTVHKEKLQQQQHQHRQMSWPKLLWFNLKKM